MGSTILEIVHINSECLKPMVDRRPWRGGALLEPGAAGSIEPTIRDPDIAIDLMPLPASSGETLEDRCAFAEAERQRLCAEFKTAYKAVHLPG